jgi:hypothetical protein
LVINWMNGEIQLSNITKRPIDEQWKKVIKFFKTIYFEQIFREMNEEVNSVSKEK